MHNGFVFFKRYWTKHGAEDLTKILLQLKLNEFIINKSEIQWIEYRIQNSVLNSSMSKET